MATAKYRTIRTIRTISIHYWHLSPIHGLPWKGNEQYNTTSEKEYYKLLKKFIKKIDKAGCNSMILNHPNFNTTLFISSGRFTQS